MAKTDNAGLVTVSGVFDYTCLKAADAKAVRSAATGIRDAINSAVMDVIEAGRALLKVKDILPHGRFGPWLESEFGWSDRHARRLMDVAEIFGAKSDTLSDLRITTTALYHLAAHSTPFGARQTALERARGGEEITVPIVEEIIMAVRKIAPRKGKGLSPERFSKALKLALKHFRNRCDPDEMLEYARQLRQFATELEKELNARVKK